MGLSIELPIDLADALRERAAERHSTVQAIAIEAIEKEVVRGSSRSVSARRVQLPLIRSCRPGSLRSMTGAEIDELPG
jgi:hypothetical protein